MAFHTTPAQPSLFDADSSLTLEQVRDQARNCRACPLWEFGTQTVFGKGPADARVMLVGEAPGEQEDRKGEPFVGAAGKLLNDLMVEAGLDRSRVYVTNVVKHRPSVAGERTRRNRAPRQSEIKACLPWFETEVRLIRPSVIVCLGAISARVMFGKDVRLTEQRGQWLPSSYAPHALATLHPAYLLRQTTVETAESLRQQVVGDLRRAAIKANAVATESG